MTVGKVKRPVVIQQPMSVDPKLELLNKVFCRVNFADWTERTTTYVPPTACDTDDDASSSTEDQLLMLTHGDTVTTSADDQSPSTSSASFDACSYFSLSNLLHNFFHQDKSISMYEIGGNPNFSSLPDPNHDIHDHYKSIIRQISMSNANLVRENQVLTAKVQNLERLLRDHVDHLNSVYYTLFHNGISALRFPDGEEVHLSQFHGILLNFIQKNETSKVRLQKPLNKFPNGINLCNGDRRGLNGLNEKTSDLSSDSSLSSMSADHERDDLRTSLIKSITKPKYNDLDDFVNWLNQPTVPMNNRRCFEDQMASSSISANNEYLKTRSLEEQTQESLRLRSPLTRSPRIERNYLSSRARSDSELFPEENGQSNNNTPESVSPMPLSARPSPAPQPKNTKAIRNR